MNSIQMIDACLTMLKEHGLRPTDICAENGKLDIKGLEVLPLELPDALEQEEAATERERRDRSLNALADLGLR